MNFNRNLKFNVCMFIASLACSGMADTVYAASVDSDRDGIPDQIEISVGTNPSIIDSDKDLDGDEWSNFEEYRFHTTINNAASFPNVTMNPFQKVVVSGGFANDQFGNVLAVDNNTAAVGARSSDSNGVDSGAVYLFSKSNNVWVQQAKLIASPAVANTFFGCSIAIQGDILAIGACGTGTGTGTNFPRSVYVFSRVNGTWLQQAKITDPENNSASAFGATLALSGNTLAIGAPFSTISGSTLGPGGVYVYTLNGGSWSQEAKLISDDGSSSDEFGSSVAAQGDLIIVGAPRTYDAALGTESGSFYTFNRTNGIWKQKFKIKLPTPSTNNRKRFGAELVLDNNTLVVSDAPLNGGASIYIYKSLSLTTTLTNGTLGFGSRLALNGDVLFASGAPNGSSSEAVYTYGRTVAGGTETWKKSLTKLRPLNGPIAIDKSNSTVIIGSPNESNGSLTDYGSVYFFDANASYADYDADGIPNNVEVSKGLNLFTPSDGILDLDNDGASNIYEYRMMTDLSDPNSIPAPFTPPVSSQVPMPFWSLIVFSCGLIFLAFRKKRDLRLVNSAM